MPYGWRQRRGALVRPVDVRAGDRAGLSAQFFVVGCRFVRAALGFAPQPVRGPGVDAELGVAAAAQQGRGDAAGGNVQAFPFGIGVVPDDVCHATGLGAGVGTGARGGGVEIDEQPVGQGEAVAAGAQVVHPDSANLALDPVDDIAAVVRVDGVLGATPGCGQHRSRTDDHAEQAASVTGLCSGDRAGTMRRGCRIPCTLARNRARTAANAAPGAVFTGSGPPV